MEIDDKQPILMKRRSIAMMLLLQIITLGLYALFWLYSTAKELRSIDKNMPSFAWIMVPIVPFFFFTMYVALQDPGQDLPLGLAFLFFLSSIGYLGLTIWWYWRYAKVLEKVVTDLPAYLTILLFFIVQSFSPLVVQYFINQTHTQSNQPTGT